MNRSPITRRTVLQTAGGFLVAGGLAHASGLAFQDAARGKIQKDLVFRTTEPRNGEPELA